MTAFKTKAGRTVLDGGGIIPDIDPDNGELHDITASLLSQQLIFDFCTQWYWENPEAPEPDKFEVSDEMYAAFEEFLKQRGFEYKTESEFILEKLEKASKEDKYHDAIKEELEALHQALAHDKQSDLYEFRDQISEFIRLELLPRYYYQEGMLKANLNFDPVVREAVSVIRDKERYEGILKP